MSIMTRKMIITIPHASTAFTIPSMTGRTGALFTAHTGMTHIGLIRIADGVRG